MPMYTYTCSKCKKTFSEFSTVEGRNRPKKCECGGTAKRDLQKEFSEMSQFNATMKENVRYSDALGVNPDQIPEFKRRWPWMDFTPDGRCIIRNREEKKRIMRARGFVELE